MNIGVVTIHGFAFHPNGRLRDAARSQGHDLELINPYHLVCTLSGEGRSLLPESCRPDIVLPRQGSPMGEYGFVVLRQLRDMGIPLVNGISGVTLARNQFLTLQALVSAGIPVPGSCFVTRSEGFYEAVDRLGGYPVVAKQPSGMGGDGVVRIDDAAAARAHLSECLVPTRGLVVQSYVPPRGRVDARILVVGDTVAGAMTLSPGPGEFRSNIHQQGCATAFDPPEEWCRLAIRAARACCLDIAGVDLVCPRQGAPLVLEVNYSPGFRGLEAATGKDIAGRIIAFAVSCRNQKTTDTQKQRAV